MCGSGRDRGGRANGVSGCSCCSRRGSGRDHRRITSEICGAMVDGAVDRAGGRD